MQTTRVQTGHDGDRRDLVATKGSGAEESEDDEKAGRGGSKKCGRPAERGPWVDDGGGKKEEINDVNNRYATVFSQEQKSFRLDNAVPAKSFSSLPCFSLLHRFSRLSSRSEIPCCYIESHGCSQSGRM